MKNLLACLLAGFMFTACAQPRDLNVKNFDEIYFGIPGKIYITQGNKNAVSVEASDSAWDKIEVVVENGVLKIKRRKSSWRSGSGDRVVAYVTVKQLTAIGVGGSGDVISENTLKVGDMDLSVSGSGKMDLDIEGDDMDISISGSGKISLEGSANEVELSISGSGKVKAENFVVNVLDANISGSGSCYITANDAIDARISGSGSIYYKGEARKINARSSGSGKVKRM